MVRARSQPDRRRALAGIAVAAAALRAAAPALRLGVPAGPLSAWARTHLGLLERRTGAGVEIVPFDTNTDSDPGKAVDVVLVAPSDLGRLAPGLVPVPDGITRPSSEIAWGNLLPVWRDRLASWSGTTLGLPVHGDLRLMVCRGDLFSDADRNRRFESRHGRPARAPVTWREALELAEFWKAETGKPGWTPLPSAPGDRLRLFYAIASGHVVERLSATDRARSEKLDEQARFGLEFDLATGKCLLGGGGFIRAGEIMARLASLSPQGATAAEPWQAFERGDAPMAVVSVSAIGRLQRRKSSRDRFSIHPVPGGDAVLPAKGGPAVPYPLGNLVPHLGMGGALACVSSSAKDIPRSWALATVLASPALSQDAVLDQGLGGPVREQQLDTGPWDGLELDRERLDQFRAALRRTLLPLDCINPSLVLRLPDARSLAGRLERGIADILAGKQALEALAAVAADWNAARSGRGAALREVRANVGLS